MKSEPSCAKPVNNGRDFDGEDGTLRVADEALFFASLSVAGIETTFDDSSEISNVLECDTFCSNSQFSTVVSHTEDERFIKLAQSKLVVESK